MHLPEMRALAATLPWAKHVSSKLVCARSKEIMNDTNPPMVLPNNYAYGRATLERESVQRGGTVSCERTGAEFRWQQLVAAYIV